MWRRMAAVAVAVVASAAFSAGCSNKSGSGSAGASGGGGTPSALTVVTPSTSGGSPSPVTPTTTYPTKPAGFVYLNLYPFKDLADAAAWQTAYRSGGTAPWHVDPDQTALSFTQGYLGFQGIDTVTSHQVDGIDAHVGVGAKASGTTAAVIHLRRLGGDQDSPWEVVGSTDTNALTIPVPKYGSVGSSPLSAGGAAGSAVHVWVRGLSSESALGDSCCARASGQKWSATVSYHSGSDQVLTVVAATGVSGTTVERFAITGVRTG